MGVGDLQSSIVSTGVQLSLGRVTNTEYFLFKSQSIELTRGPPELVQHFRL